jgi:hypothetical protein
MECIHVSSYCEYGNEFLGFLKALNFGMCFVKLVSF